MAANEHIPLRYNQYHVVETIKTQPVQHIITKWNIISFQGTGDISVLQIIKFLS